METEEKDIVTQLEQKFEELEQIVSERPLEAIEEYKKILENPEISEEIRSIKEKSIYRLVRLYVGQHDFDRVLQLLNECNSFFSAIPKAKTAKIVRTIIDIVATIPQSQDLQITLCKSVIEWCNNEKRTFLRHRIESRLASLYFEKQEYAEAVKLITALLRELKKLDDKQLLVETHLIEARVFHALRNLPKAKAALTSAKSAGNSIDVGLFMQAELDQMSGILHCEEGDYTTSYSYFLEAFESFDNQNEPKRAITCLKYMILCKVLDGDTSDVNAITSGKWGIKYASRDLESLAGISRAAKKRSLEEFSVITQEYYEELTRDLLIKSHLDHLYDRMLEANLLKIIEPFSCVEIHRVAELINLPIDKVSRKLSQMILDEKFNGILDQGRGHLIVFDGTEDDKSFSYSLEVISNMSLVVSSLFKRARGLAH